jgi:hypothetical protein
MSRLLPSHRHVVDVAPSPVLARLEGLDNWMAGLLVMGGRVTVRRRVAASDVPAGQAEPQMYPAVPRRKALGTSLRSERVDRLQTDDVFACGGHVSRDYFRLRMWRPRLPGQPLRAGRLDEPGTNHDYHGSLPKQDASPSEPGYVHDQRRAVGVVRRLPRSARSSGSLRCYRRQGGAVRARRQPGGVWQPLLEDQCRNAGQQRHNGGREEHPRR